MTQNWQLVGGKSAAITSILALKNKDQTEEAPKAMNPLRAVLLLQKKNDSPSSPSPALSSGASSSSSNSSAPASKFKSLIVGPKRKQDSVSDETEEEKSDVASSPASVREGENDDEDVLAVTAAIMTDIIQQADDGDIDAKSEIDVKVISEGNKESDLSLESRSKKSSPELELPPSETKNKLKVSRTPTRKRGSLSEAGRSSLMESFRELSRSPSPSPSQFSKAPLSKSSSYPKRESPNSSGGSSSQQQTDQDPVVMDKKKSRSKSASRKKKHRKNSESYDNSDNLVLMSSAASNTFKRDLLKSGSLKSNSRSERQRQIELNKSIRKAFSSMNISEHNY